MDATRKIASFVSHYQYEAAREIIEDTIDSLSSAEQEVWKGLSELMQGYQAWEHFDYLVALRRLGSGVKQLELCVKFHVDPSIAAFFHKVSGNFITLTELRDATVSFTALHPLLVQDLVSNAARRASQHRYDEAVARLYRALDMVGQIAFKKQTGCDPSRVEAARLPASLRGEYASRYVQGDGETTLNLPLLATFALLQEMGHPAGRAFFSHAEELGEVLAAWEASILGRGASPIDREVYEQFSELMEELFLEEPLTEFVKMTTE